MTTDRARQRGLPSRHAAVLPRSQVSNPPASGSCDDEMAERAERNMAERAERHAQRLRGPSCGGLVNLAAGVVDLITRERRAVCWDCGTPVTWGDDVMTITSTDGRSPI